MDMATRLDLFIDVVQHGSFAKAADLRNLDRSVLSKQIKNLEDDLGIRLLNRSTRSLSLTDAGAEILKQAESVRELLANTQRLAESYHSEPKGLIKITGPTPFGYLYLTKAVNYFMKKYPDIHIRLYLDDLRSDIIGEQYDIAFRVGALSDSNLIAKKLADNPLAILASQSFIEEYGEPKTPEELMKLPAIIYNNGEFTMNKIDFCSAPGCGDMQTYTMKGRYKVNQAKAILSAAQDGIGYAVVPLFTLEKNIKELGLIPLLTNYKMPKTSGHIHAVYPHRNQTPIVKLFIETVQEIIGETPIWESYIDDYASMYK
ncbi:LysR family transcriptional regulator [Vibrio algarum]|uniref:LysR family transcriptional regulator n=1 Tax=Vibrio algarum TaxID=3020714 RepID=A0ABT4YVP0_9VIBR|nr:LysR family transcriptional regulator [Vibrio sp. KJ40-1]MDB1125626.1 LysR family transcriptional regulator [Vibrio sp. KJ40-1]